MAEDPIVEEVRAARDEHAKKFGYDLEAIFRDLKAKEKETGRRYSRLSPRPVGPAKAARPS